MDIMRSVVGMVVLLAIAFLLSVNKKSISLRTVGAALLLQIAIGGIMLYFPPGKWAVEQAALGVHKVMSYSDAGSAFIFGSLVGPKMDVLFDGAGFIFAFRVLPAIIFVTALISLLYYIGVMGLLIRILGSIFQKALNISKIESFVAVTTIFLGQNEIPAIVKPFIDRMNRNELFTAICSGMASIAGSMMIGYAGMGVPIDYLLAASLMAIPGGILFARILSPATEPSQVTFENLSFSETPPKSIIEAAANGAMTGLKIADGTVIPCDRAVLAIGHSARDTFEMLDASGVPMEPKPFAMGVRIEQKQRDIDIAQYGGENPALPPADYKLVEHLDGETVYTFCMCPGGFVVAAASEEGRVVTNGMSYADRDGENANAALLVTVNPADFPYEGNLGGMRWQREIEGNAYRVSGSYRAPAQKVGDFLAGRPSDRPGRVTPTYRPGVTWCDLHDVLPGKITDAIALALPRLDGKLKGFADPDAVMTAPETRSSSPVRIIRDSSRQSSLRGLYPTGEGAGYAGGIMSAAIDGIMTAETIIMEENYERETDQQMAP